jgi:hypothetical protein
MHDQIVALALQRPHGSAAARAIIFDVHGEMTASQVDHLFHAEMLPAKQYNGDQQQAAEHMAGMAEEAEQWLE